MSAAGALLGALAAVGLLLIVAAWLAHRPPRLVDRIRSTRRRSRPKDHGPLGAPRELVWPLITSRWPSTGSAAVERRLRQAGRTLDLTRHRLDSLVWSAAGAAAGLGLGVVLAWRQGSPPVAPLALAAVGAASGWMLHDRALSSTVKRRSARMTEQLPTVADLLAFAVAAGEAPVAAIERVSATLRGELAGELTTVVHRVRGGMSFVSALRELSDNAASADIARFVDGVAVASERGTPMADVLRAQAADARATGRRRLIEKAGRKEILMLTPVVFLILPIVVVIALFPGLHGLQLTA